MAVHLEVNSELMAAQTGAQAEAQFIPIIIGILADFLIGTDFKSSGHPADNKPKFHIMDLS